MNGVYLYSGDMNLEHGGLFISLPDSPDSDYANAIKVTDLESAIGYDGAAMIESGVIFIGRATDERGRARLDSALPVVGARAIWPIADGESWPDIDDNGTLLKTGTRAHWLTLCYAIDAYMGLDGPNIETIGGPDTADSFDSWTLDSRISGTIADYIADSYGVTIADALAADESPVIN